MKKTIPVFFFLLTYSYGYNQITSPVIRANFGVDGDLRANFFNGTVQASGDDWFRQADAGSGQFIIDTTGAAAITSRYVTDMAFRRLPFFRTMRYPGFSLINNHLLLDAIFYRDYHGNDSTVFASGGNKNGDSPDDWSCPISQGIPDKNDILDIMVHIRRAGPGGTDSLWLMGGLSLDNTTGDRYFDFEMYQTDIYYDRATRQFYGFGPDAGHTSWEFDASGNVTKPGDIIFSVEYQSSSISFIEARIWVNETSLSVSPAAFDWSGDFDGGSSGATYGYANIHPKAAGAYFTGLQCGDNTWAGPFAVVLQDESLVTDYNAKQYVEFSVNLTKLGLDPMTSISGDACSSPFRRIMVKTRSSASFSAELKDFVAPFEFFLAPRVDVLTESPYLCARGGTAEIYVTNPISTSVYQWVTPNGNIVTSPTGPSITVDTPGIYIVTQFLQAGCSAYASDTIQVQEFPSCEVLTAGLTSLRGENMRNTIRLNWEVLNNEQVQYLEIQRSSDGLSFTTIGRINKQLPLVSTASYTYDDDAGYMIRPFVYFRIKIIGTGRKSAYSNTIKIIAGDIQKDKITIFPNPAKDITQLQVSSDKSNKIRIDIVGSSGNVIFSTTTHVQRGNNVITLDGLAGHARGVYLVQAYMGDRVLREKIILSQ
jgi:hypothetical protein